MLGTVTKDESQARSTLKRIKAAGYDGLELNRFMIHPSSLMVRMLTRAAGMPTGKGGNLPWKEMLKSEGLEIVSLHTDLGALEREPDVIIKEARELNTENLVITGMYRFDYSNRDNVLKLCERLNAAGEKLKNAGIRLFYHNHNVELLNVQGGETRTSAYNLLISHTDPAYVNFEFDSYWFTEAGADAKAWMEKLGSRMKLWHVTDRGSRQTGPSMTPILKSDCLELGCGTMDLTGLRDIALKCGIEAVVLESHKNWIDKDPVKSLEVSGKWLSENL